MSNNVISLFPEKDFSYIMEESKIVGIQCENISIQLTPDLHNIMLGDIEIKREEFLAFILATGIDCEIEEIKNESK